MKMELEIKICDMCHDECPANQLTVVDGQEICPACLEEHTVICLECGERIWSRDNAGTDALPLCQDCYEDYYTSLKYMAEQVEGSFSFTVLDDRDQLYFVKGDSPLCIFHYPDVGYRSIRARCNHRPHSRGASFRQSQRSDRR